MQILYDLVTGVWRFLIRNQFFLCVNLNTDRLSATIVPKEYSPAQGTLYSIKHSKLYSFCCDFILIYYCISCLIFL